MGCLDPRLVLLVLLYRVDSVVSVACVIRLHALIELGKELLHGLVRQFLNTARLRCRGTVIRCILSWLVPLRSEKAFLRC